MINVYYSPSPIDIPGTKEDLISDYENKCFQFLQQVQTKLHLFKNILFLKNFYCYSITLVCLFLPIPPPHPSQNPLPPPSSSLLPLDFVHVSFIVVPVIPFPHCPLPTPLWLLLHCS